MNVQNIMISIAVTVLGTWIALYMGWVQMGSF